MKLNWDNVVLSYFTLAFLAILSAGVFVYWYEEDSFVTMRPVVVLEREGKEVGCYHVVE